MTDLATQPLLQKLNDVHLPVFAVRLTEWLIADLNKSQESVPDFTESRAKALLRAAAVVDDPTLHDFARLVEGGGTAVRLALHDLLNETGLIEDEEVTALATTSAAISSVQGTPLQSPISWLILSIAAHAWKSGYPLYQLDPASPPGEYSPAGQLIKRAATFLRQQIQRSATERDKLGKKLAYNPGDGTPTLETMPNSQPIAPVPPHFRPPIPVRYPEVSRETLHVNENEQTPNQGNVTRNAPLTITSDDLQPANQRPVRMPEIRIRADQVPQRRPSTPRQPRPQPSSSEGGNLGTAVRQRFSRDKEPLRSTKLRVIVQDVQDGPGLYGIQVQVRCKGINAHVAGTTNRDGVFLCELPVRVHSGLTYDVDITWPRDLGGEVERKSVTLNVDRTEFKLPFFRRLS
ncbi:MAG: hypothetical protein H6654_02815 [Ardenticatenaceae bacterium]|nr:hypothetical protein [Anaerolineales bacterium]MCB8941120.1 hypothetical protein [Ardenticatenaceae bacterium]MCB8972461.1 hypothetical protein [Ardenticatenaceae bacterium]